MFLYSIAPRPIDLSGAGSYITIKATVKEMETAYDRWYYEAYYYDSNNEKQTIYSSSTTLMGYTSYTFQLYAAKTDLANIISDKYEGIVYVEISSDGGAWDWGGVELKDSSYALPSVIAAVSYSDTLSAGGDEYGIQTKTKVTADFSASSQGRFPITKYGMTISSSAVNCTIAGTTATSPAIGTYGTKIIIPGVYSGGKWFYAGTAETIEVLPYSEPAIVKLPAEEDIICRRAASDGTYLANGQYLFVGCKKNYAPLNAAGADRNSALVEACISENGGAFGAWFTISGINDSDTVEYTSGTAVLSNASSTYEVKIKITDAASNTVTVFRIGTASFPLHLAAGGRAVGLGQVASSGNDRVDFGWPAYFNGGIGRHVIFQSATAKASGSTISSAEGDFTNIGKYSMFLLDGVLYISSANYGGFSVYRCDGGVLGFSYSEVNERITVGTNGLKSIIALL